MKFQVETRLSVTKIDPQVPHIIISISDSPENRAAPATNDNTLDVQHFYFHDVDSNVSGDFTVFDEQLARRILNFFIAHRHKAKLVIAHCDAGQCRSPAVVAALQKITTGDDEIWFKTKRPNRLVYRTMLNHAHSRGFL